VTDIGPGAGAEDGRIEGVRKLNLALFGALPGLRSRARHFAVDFCVDRRRIGVTKELGWLFLPDREHLLSSQQDFNGWNQIERNPALQYKGIRSETERLLTINGALMTRQDDDGRKGQTMPQAG
jgi:hypothetical protein